MPILSHLPLRWLLAILSALLVALGQEAAISALAPLAAAIGFALFWQSIHIYSLKKRLLCSLLWFSAIQAIQLSWITANHYAGGFIYIVHVIICLLFGSQFALLTLCIPTQLRQWRWSHFIALPALWVLLEWSRLWLLCGISWNPIGLALATHLYSRQLAAFGGVYLLSFAVLLANLAVLASWQKYPPSLSCLKWLKKWTLPLCAIALPYLFGIMYLKVTAIELPPAERSLAIALVDMRYSAEEKYLLNDDWRETLIASEEQWQNLLCALKPLLLQPTQCIVLPEGALPGTLQLPSYSSMAVKRIFEQQWGADKVPAAVHTRQWNNHTLLQHVAQQLNAHVLVGADEKSGHNSALHFSPQGKIVDRYGKQILVPMGEYIPFAWLKKIALYYGIADSFIPGQKVGCFRQTPVPMGISICYEETFGNLMRHCRAAGSQVLINLTSDIWFPHSTLPRQHLAHARLRTVENGFSLARACIGGITAVVDYRGETIWQLEDSPDKVSVHCLHMPLSTCNTLYTKWGDSFIVIVAIAAAALHFFSIARGKIHRSKEPCRVLSIE